MIQFDPPGTGLLAKPSLGPITQALLQVLAQEMRSQGIARRQNVERHVIQG